MSKKTHQKTIDRKQKQKERMKGLHEQAISERELTRMKNTTFYNYHKKPKK